MALLLVDECLGQFRMRCVVLREQRADLAERLHLSVAWLAMRGLGPWCGDDLHFLDT